MDEPIRPPLSELEGRTMSIVWRLGEATAEQVGAELEADPPLKDSTIRTILRRLEEKGYARHRTEGRTYVYAPAVAPQSVAAEAVQGIVQRLCNGSLEALLVGMIDREIVSAEQLRALSAKISRANESSRPSQKKHPRQGGK